MKYTEESGICIEKHVLVKKSLPMSSTWMCQYELKRVESDWVSIKEKVPNEAVSKESLLGHKGPITINFLENVIHASCCQLLRQISPYSLNDHFTFRKYTYVCACA